MAELQALSVGHAVDTHAASIGTVHSVFARAVNLEVRGDLWTVASAERPDLPFGIRVPPVQFAVAGLRRGDPVHVRAGYVGIGCAGGRIVVDCRSAPRWRPVFADRLAPGLDDRLAVVTAAAGNLAWCDSALLAQAVTSALHDPSAVGVALAGVVGRGPGSTPAGDDVLIGILAVLLSPQAGWDGAQSASRLRCGLWPLLSTTTDLSAHLLRQGADGRFSRPVHELLCALVRDPGRDALVAAVDRVVALGATSGADLCMGVLACAPAFLKTCQERAAA